jgi:hypothetical protein
MIGSVTLRDGPRHLNETVSSGLLSSSSNRPNDEGFVMLNFMVLIYGVLGADTVPIDARYDIRPLYQYYLRLQACQRSLPEHDDFPKMLSELRRIAMETEAQLSQAEIEVEWNNQARLFLQSGMNRPLNGWYWLTACKMQTSEAAQKLWQHRRQPARPILPKKDF